MADNVVEETTFEDIALHVPRLLLPRGGIDLSKWCVIACDQYTSEPEYWQRVKDFVGDAPSMLNLVYPEVYMPQKRDQEFIAAIERNMKTYMHDGVLEEQQPGFLLIDRKTPSVECRKGLLVALDLESYSFEHGSQSLIRATEKTIEARLPPRIAIREKASIESPHILVLIDDPERTVIEPLFSCRNEMKRLYDFELMENSGHLTGYHVSSPEHINRVADALRKLGGKDLFQQKYGTGEESGPILYAVGDGNHSLATAKRCWEAQKAAGAHGSHPARYALVELNNVYDEGLHFHPIHRLVEKVNVEDMVQDLEAFFASTGCTVNFTDGADLESPCGHVNSHQAVHRFEFCSAPRSGVYSITNSTAVLTVATLDNWLNTYLAKNREAEIDYVHESYTIRKKGKEAGCVGFLLPSMDKNDLVKTVVKEGALPRKTFSMGHAPEKRFYFECKHIV